MKSSDVAQHKRIMIFGLAANFIDGLDVMIMSYLSISLAAAMGLSPSQVGLMFSLGVTGMVLGAFLIAPLADRYGYRPVVLLLVGLATLGMVMSAMAPSYVFLLAARIVTGLGIGGSIPVVYSLVATNAPAGREATDVGIVQTGYPLGSALTGVAIAQLLKPLGWQGCLYTGAALTMLLFAMALWALHRLPERPAAARASQGAGHGAAAILAPFLALIQRENPVKTVCVLLVSFIFFGVLYFILSWLPKILNAGGLGMDEAIRATFIYNFGAMLGTVLIPYLGRRWDLARMILLALVLAVGIIALLSRRFADSWMIYGLCALLGIFLHGGFNAFFSWVTTIYEAPVRATALGMASAMGRIGSICSPLLVGILLQMRLSPGSIFINFAAILSSCVVMMIVLDMRLKNA